MAVLNFFPVQKLIFWPFLKLQKMDFGQKVFSWNWFIWFQKFFCPGLFKFFCPTVHHYFVYIFYSPFCLLIFQVIMAFYPPPPLIRTRTRRPKMKPYQPPKRFWLPTNEHFFVCVLTMRVHTRVYAGGRFKRTCPARVPLCTALPQLNRRVLFLFLICQ